MSSQDNGTTLSIKKTCLPVQMVLHGFLGLPLGNQDKVAGVVTVSIYTQGQVPFFLFESARSSNDKIRGIHRSFSGFTAKRTSYENKTLSSVRTINSRT